MCALLTGGGIYCWGYNGEGELGLGDITNKLSPTEVPGLGAGGLKRECACVLLSGLL